ncbi:hypothetical protein niasHS_002803 [Heterodera schachtii]|uniref:Uncharacterized protein n=1 Tax=Heterodera schachtii TaxID=97005 RepID=A0ABD2K2G6_HETSC
MPKQVWEWYDYTGPLVVWIVFFSVIFVISVTCILWCCIKKDDDPTVFAKFVGVSPCGKKSSDRGTKKVKKRKGSKSSSSEKSQ